MRSRVGGGITVMVNGEPKAVGHNTATSTALDIIAKKMNGESVSFTPADQICLADTSGYNKECVSISSSDWVEYDDASYGNGYKVTKKINISNNYTLGYVRIYGGGSQYFGGSVDNISLRSGDVVYVTAYITSYIDSSSLTCSGVSGCGISSTEQFNRDVAGIILGLSSGVLITNVKIKYGTSEKRDLPVTRTRSGTTIEYEATLDVPFSSATTLDRAVWYAPDTEQGDPSVTWNVTTTWSAQSFDPDVYHTFKLSLEFASA